MKYIRHRELGFLVFEEHIEHKEYARYFGGVDYLLSAGFVRDNGAGQICCFGESPSLGLSARDEDTAKIRHRFGIEDLEPIPASPANDVLQALFAPNDTSALASSLGDLHARATPGNWSSNCAGEIFATIDGQPEIRIGHFQGCAADAAAVCAFHNNASKIIDHLTSNPHD